MQYLYFEHNSRPILSFPEILPILDPDLRIVGVGSAVWLNSNSIKKLLFVNWITAPTSNTWNKYDFWNRQHLIIFPPHSLFNFKHPLFFIRRLILSSSVWSNHAMPTSPASKTHETISVNWCPNTCGNEWITGEIAVVLTTVIHEFSLNYENWTHFCGHYTFLMLYRFSLLGQVYFNCLARIGFIFSKKYEKNKNNSWGEWKLLFIWWQICYCNGILQLP